MFNFPSYHYEILADMISHKYRSAIIPKYSRKRFENRLFVCDSNISCAGKVSFYNCTFNCDISQNGECITILPRGEAVFKSCTFKRLHSNSGLFLSGNKGSTTTGRRFTLALTVRQIAWRRATLWRWPWWSACSRRATVPLPWLAVARQWLATLLAATTCANGYLAGCAAGQG